MMRPLESELHALVDGRLPEARAAELREWLAQRPEEEARVRAWQQQRESLHALFDPILEEPLPAQLQRIALPAPWWKPALPKLAAALAWLAIGALIGFLARGPAPGPGRFDGWASLPREAAMAHAVYSPEVRHPVEVGADQEAHLVQWLSRRLGSSIIVPDLNAEGFSLVGGRLLASDEGPAAQFMYQDATGNRLTLYVRHDAANTQTAFRFAGEGSIRVFYWMDGPFGYALSGAMERRQLLDLAQASYRQLARK